MSEESLTFESLKKIVEEVRAQYPLLGFVQVESDTIPSGVQYWESDTQIAIVYLDTNSYVITDKPTFLGR